MKEIKNWDKECENLLIEGVDLCLHHGLNDVSYSIAFTDSAVEIKIFWDSGALHIAIRETQLTRVHISSNLQVG